MKSDCEVGRTGARKAEPGHDWRLTGRTRTGYDGAMPIERVESLDDPRVADYRHVPDPELLRRGDVFVAEGRLVVRTLLASSPFRTRSVLLTESAFRALADVIEPRLAGLPVFLVEQGTIEALTGFNIHRGCLAMGERPPRATVDGLLTRLPTARRLVVLERIANADNMGGIFRNAGAFGAGAVVLGPGCCDPLYRKAIRVSMGAALRVPFCHAGDWAADLRSMRAAGFTIAALVPAEDADDIARHASTLSPGARLALLAGSEGAGLTPEALAHADARLRIPMAPGVDSLNVAMATGIALHRFFASGVS
jgi:tRNA G18 (ribose-2'-O)-methylase SpoU